MMPRARDERERLVDLRGTEIGYVVLGFGLLVLIAFRSLRGDESWDLLGLLVVSGFVGQGYVAWRRAFTTRLVACAAGTAAVSFAVSLAVALAR